MADGYVLLECVGQGVEKSVLGDVLHAGGRAVAMLSCGVDQFGPGFERVSDEIDEGRLLALSPYPPEAGHTERLGLASRVLVGAMAEALVLVNPEKGPSSWPSVYEGASLASKALVLTSDEETTAKAWIDAGALQCADAGVALSALRALYGNADDGIPSTAAAEAIAKSEPIYFTDAASAIALLGSPGKVPQSLARRLEESGRLVPPGEEET